MASRLTARLKAIQTSTDQAEIVAALGDPSAVIVEAAAKRVEQPWAAGALVRAYRRLHEGGPAADKGCWARMAILEALGRIGAPEGDEVARLGIRTVQVEPVSGGMADTATGLRVAAAGLLANLRPPGALLDLAWLLHDFEPNAPCSAAERPFAKMAARIAAAKAIGQLGDPAGAAVLYVKLAFPGEEVPDVLAECMDGLAALEEPRTMELLTPWLDHPSPYLAAAAAAAIASAGKEGALPLLVEALDRVVADAREPVVYAIGSVRAEATRRVLEGLSRHPDETISRTARQLLD